MGILSVNLNNINLEEDDHDTIIHIKLLVWCIKFEKCKAFKKELNY